jgi:alkylhydroperoxidase family enzyme
VEGINAKLVQAVLDNWETAPIGNSLRSVLGFLQKLTLQPQQVTKEDIETLRSSGLSDQAIEEAIYVCFSFNVMDRLADALEFDIPTPQQFKQGGRFLYRLGYRATSLWG